MVHGHIISDVNDLGLPDLHSPRCEFRREIAHGHIISEVVDFIFPGPYPLKLGPGRSRLFHWDWRVLDLDRVFRRDCLRGLEGFPLLDGSRSW